MLRHYPITPGGSLGQFQVYATAGTLGGLAGSGSDSLGNVTIGGVLSADTIAALPVVSGVGNNLTVTAGTAQSGAGGNVVAQCGLGTGSTSATTNAGKFVVQNPDRNPNHQVRIYFDGSNSKIEDGNSASAITMGGGSVGVSGYLVTPLELQAGGNALFGSPDCRIGSTACNGVGFIATKAVQWGSSLTSAGSYDISLYRIVAGVVASGSGSNSGVGWIQSSAGEATLASAFTNSSGTLTNTNLSPGPLIAGRSYRIDGYLIVSNTNGADGVQFDFNGGTATMTGFDVTFSAVGTNTPGTVSSTSLSGVLNYTLLTGTVRIWVKGTMKCNAAGTFKLRCATNTTVSGTLTLAAESYIDLADTVTM